MTRIVMGYLSQCTSFTFHAKKIVWLSCLVSTFFLLPFLNTLHAATDSFLVRTLVGGDVLAPTIPTGLSATAISISQIDLSWTESTDDSGTVSGYHIWRDSVLIATTTATTYSDTGLASSTSYSYYVTAFDPFFNESASSSSSTATTLTPAVSSSDLSISQYGTKLTAFGEMLTSLQVLPQKDSALIQFETNANIKTVLQWGRTASYEIGSIAEQVFTTRHKTRIDELLPNTRYEYIILGEDKFGRTGVVYTGAFTTLPPDDVFAPGNVTNLTAQKDGNDIVLSWTNPSESDFSKVRILRNDTFYPSDVADGWIVYDGDGTEVRDRDAFLGKEGERQYYTVFSYDTLGNISSGAVVTVSFDDVIATQTPPVADETKNDLNLSFSVVSFVQEGGVIESLQNDIVSIDGSKQLTIRIPYSALPEHLKTVLVTVTDSRNENRAFSFLLRVNTERTYYEGTIAPFGTSGDFPVTISVFDYTTSQIGYTRGVLEAYLTSIHTETDSTKAIGGFLSYLINSGIKYVVWSGLFIVFFVLIIRRLAHV